MLKKGKIEMEDRSPKVTICCLAFNHQSYIRKTLDGFLSQKTTFPFEILVHDDASTDHTPEIIREYQEQHPDIIFPVYQTENQYQKGKKLNYEFQFVKARGKYIAMCEGDDYWTDEYKLQKQFEALEAHPECSVCTHKVVWIQESGEEIGKTFPPYPLKEGVISPKRYMEMEVGNIEWTFQTSSYFFRTSYILEQWEEKPEYMMKSMVGDLPMMLHLITKGSIYYIPEKMSCYRLASSSSVTQYAFVQKERQTRYFKNQIESMKAYDAYTKGIYAEEIEKYCRHYEFSVYLNQRNFKGMMQKSYRENWKKLSSLRRGYYRGLAVFPWLHFLGDCYNAYVEKRRASKERKSGK